MSIMDHDPKYAKLRLWREERQMRLMRERFRRTLQLVPPRRLNIPAYNWKPITAMREDV